MKPRHTVLLFFLIVIIVSMSVLLYRACHYLQKPQNNALSVIPNNTAFIVKGAQTESLLEFNKNNSSFFASLYSKKQTKRLDFVLNNILSQEKCRQLVENSSFYLSLHDHDAEELLLVIETSRNYNHLLSDFAEYLCADLAHKSFIYKNNSIHSLPFEGGGLFFNLQNGLLLMTFSENIMRQAINKLTVNDDGLQVAVNNIPVYGTGNSGICFYLQYKYFIPHFKNRLRKTSIDVAAIDMFKPCSWSALQLDIKKREFLLSGYTQLDTSIARHELLIHKNNKLDFIKILPYNANRIFSIKANRADDWKNMPSTLQMDEDFFSLMYLNNIVTFEMETDSSVFNYLLIHSENISEAAFHLFNSLNSRFADNNFILDTINVGSMMVGRVDLPNFVVSKMGINNRLSHLKYYTLVENYIVFTDKKEGILAYIFQLRNHKSIAANKEYQLLQDYFTDNANLFYYHSFNDNDKFRSIRLQLSAQSNSILSTNMIIGMK